MERLITKTDELLVDALCAGFDGRAETLRRCAASRRTLMEYAYLNGKIWEAAMEVTANEKESLLFISEIGSRTGYVKSGLCYGESAYKEKKSAIRKGILLKLHLFEE